MTLARSKNSVGMDLTQGPIMRTLITFALPIILTNLIQQLYSLVDVMVIGKYVGNIGTVGINTGGEVADLLSPVAMGFSSAGQIYIAQLTGSADETRIKRTFGTLLTFMLLISTVLVGVTILFATPILRFINCPEEAMEQARAYMYITALGFPFVFGYNAICSILRGMGESRRPLIFIIVAAMVNIFLDLLLVVVIPLEAAGTAIATVASQFGAFLAAGIFLWKKKDKFDFQLSRSFFRVDPRIMWILIKLGIPHVARSLLVRSSMLWINSTANSYGMVVSATNSIGNKLQKFLEVIITGVDGAAGTMVGQNLGAKKPDRAGKVVLSAMAAAWICATVVTVLCIFTPESIFGLFTSDPEVIALGVKFLRIIIVHFYSSATVGAFQSIITGSGFVTFGVAIGILDGVICKIGLSLLFVYGLGMGYMGLFWGVACSRILPSILCGCYFFSGRWRTRKLLTEK